MNYKGNKICDNCFSVIKGEPCPACGFKKAKYKPEFGILPVGTLLSNRYSVGQAIGRGGFGVTYKAFDTLTGKIVAIKEYYPNGLVHRDSGTKQVTVTDGKNTSNFELGAEKFYEEAKTVSKFNGNPNIVGVYEFFYENNTVYYVMEYLAGMDLKRYIAEHGGKLSAGQAVYLARTLTDALTITHSLDVLHRDISPDNIFVLDSGNIKLIDFGAARQVIAEQSKSLSVILKQGFAPFEQYQRRGKQGPWTDVYALGATIFYAVTGTVMDDATERIDNEDIGNAAQYGLDEEFWAILEKCVAIKPENRYQSMLELKEALNKLEIEPVPLVAPVTSEIGATIAISDMTTDESDGQAQEEIGATIAVSQDEIGATVAVPSQEIGATVAVPSEEIVQKNDTPHENKIIAFLKTKKGIITIAAALGIIIIAVAVVLVVTSINKRSNGPGQNHGNHGDVTRDETNPITNPDVETEETTTAEEDVTETEPLTSGEEPTEPQETVPVESTTQTPTTQAPTTQAPTIQAPTTQAPTTQAPTTQAPTTQAPTTQAPTTEAPTTTAVQTVQNVDWTINCPQSDDKISGKYTGEWKDGKPNGQGQFSSVERDDQVRCWFGKGTWVNGQLNGQSKIVQAYYREDVYTPDWGDYWGNFDMVTIYVGNLTNGKYDGELQVYEASDPYYLGGGWKYTITYSNGQNPIGGDIDFENKNWDLYYHY